MEKTTRDEYLKALEETSNADQVDNDENPELTEGERLAHMADAPRRRADGGVVTSDRYRQLTASQTAFVLGVINGKTLKQAYRDAYPNDNSTDQGISANANRLFKHPKVQDMLESAWGEITENMVEDMTATKRYVMKKLLEHSKTAKQEGTKIKCLELLGKASGMFTQAEVKDERAVSTDQLKGELAKYLRTLKRTTGISDVESRAV
jgi:hypothetical protein